MNKMSKKLFITGIPTGGKSYLAKRLAEKMGAIVVSTDDLREAMHDDPRYNKWVNFYLNQDEKSYYTTTTPEQQWENLAAQSEGMWPYILEKIDSYQNETKPVIFEGVNILPHLANRDLSFQGVVIVGKSFEDTVKRIKEDHRWGNTEELWNLEADSFFNVERPKYKKEAEKYNYPVFETADEAFDTALKLITTHT
jgi:2-phosphoglycerate kinase